MFACPAHWRMVPRKLQQALWREYREGQERDKRPSKRYMAVQRLCVARIAKAEGFKDAAASCVLRAHAWREISIREGDGDPLEGLV